MSNYALFFDGSDDYVEVSASANTELRISGDCSAFMWIEPATWSPPDTNTAMLRCGVGADLQYSLFYVYNNQALRFHWYDGTFHAVDSASSTVLRSVRNYVGFVRESNMVQFYLNAAPLGVPQAVTTPTVAATVLRVGATSSTTQRYRGAIDDVRVFNRALSAAEVMDGHQGFPVPSGCVLHWKFDEGAGTTTADSSDNSNTGTLTNGPVWVSGFAPDITVAGTVARTRNRRGFPELAQDTPTGLRRFLTKLKETVEVRNAERGSPLDANPTFRDLIDAGVIKVDPQAPLTANGREFTLATSTWITSNIPNWVTDNTNPPTPTGLTAMLNVAALVLTWDQPTFSNYKQTLIYRASSNNLSAAELIGSNTGNTYVDDLPATGTQYFYWIRHESKSELLSDFNDVNGTSITNAPTAPTVSHAFSGPELVLSWTTPSSNLAIQYYIISYGASPGQTVEGISQSNSFRFVAEFGGSRTYWVQGVNINGALGTAGSTSVTITNPSQPVVSLSVTGGSLVFSFEAAQGSLPIDYYEIRHGASWAAGEAFGTTFSTRREFVVNWTGTRTFWVSAYDTAGNISAAGSASFDPSLPSVGAVTPEVIDNNVLLRWVGTAGTLPIAHYRFFKNDVFVSTTDAQFMVVFESTPGDYTYGIAPVDTAGNEGARSSVTSAVSQPPDFVLFSNQASDLSGTKTATFEDERGALVASTSITETWATHFTDRGWNTIQDQINDGYDRYLVGKTTGSYVETVDYGTVIPSSKITMSPTEFFQHGTVTMTPTLEISATGAFAGEETSFPGVWSVHATSFRYVRFAIDFSASASGTGLATDTANLLGIKPLSYVLDLKLKTYQGMTSCVSTDVGGTAVDITGQFLDVQSIVVTPAGTSAVIPVYDFTDVPEPTEFKILLFNTSGARVSGTASWTVRGV